MSFRAKRELLAQVAPRYRDATGARKSHILDEFVAATGYARKYAIRLLSDPAPPPIHVIRRPRARRYGREVQEALAIAWAAANYVCTKRLVPFLPELVASLERHGHLSLRDEARAQLLDISPATADRLLQSVRQRDQVRGVSTTKPGSLLRHQVPVRTFTDWNDTRPGFMEADLVAHCGARAEGSYLYTLVLTDVATAWTECLPLPHRSQEAVLQALDHARRLLPFPLLGLDTDNGSEFLNAELVAYCAREQITFTRGRPYKKNDQCYVEQKNGSVVRALVGYDRYEGQLAYRQLSELYRAVRLYINGFQASMKLRTKQRNGSHVTRRYDEARTPLQRLSAVHMPQVLTPAVEERLQALFRALDPVLLLQQIESLQDALWRHAVVTTTVMAAAPAAMAATANEAAVHFDPTRCGLGGERVGEGSRSGGTGTRDVLPLSLDEVLGSPEAHARHGKRRYRRTKPAVPRTWRTRADPFADVWAEICQRLEAAPERTAKSLLEELQQRYGGQYPEALLRTLQRRVKAWRARAILQFDEQWLTQELLPGQSVPRPLRAALAQ